MPKLEWDKSGERYYETGVRNGVLYLQNSNGTYQTGVVWNGLTGVTESPDGAEPNDLYADDIKYASLRSAENFGGTIEAYTYPEEFGLCDGTASPVAGVYIGQQTRQPFGFVYKTQVGSDTLDAESQDGYKLHIWYNCTASPSEKSYETINDSPDAITFSWEITTTPVPVTNYKPVATITIDTTKLTEATKTKLTALETTLFGGDGESALATLPSPADVIAALS